jgi:NADPH2:quinone reductase
MSDVTPYAVIARQPGGVEVLEQIDLLPPSPGSGEVLIRQTAIGMNFHDIYVRSGLYPWPVANDLILGSEGAGVVEAVGHGVTGFRDGDRVAYTVTNGGYATHRLVPAAMLLPLPDAVSDAQAAGSVLKGLTAFYLIHDSYPVKAGETVLFHAAAGGVGLIAGQWLRHKGVTALGTAGGPEKVRLAQDHGYAHVIDYRAEDFVARLREMTGGAGVPVVYDSVGKDTVAGSLQCLQNFGHLICFGQSSGMAEDFTINDLARGSFYLQRPILFHHASDRAWLTRAAEALFGAIADGTIRITIGATRPLSDVALAHEDLVARRTMGSTILIP